MSIMPSALAFQTAMDGGACANVVQTLGEMLGFASHPYLDRLAETRADSPREQLADALHFLCLAHGSRPSLLEMVARRLPVHTPWLEQASDGFVGERSYLASLVVNAGPTPSGAGQLAAEQAVQHQRQAMLTLAQSERDGCAIGASLALLFDWHALRPVLDKIADRIGVEPIPAADLPSMGELQIQAAMLDSDPRRARAVQFAAQQLFAQHRALMDILQQRHAARG